MEFESNHSRQGSLSSLGSLGSDTIGTMLEDSSEHSRCTTRIVAEMAILASSSPEIRALNLSMAAQHNFTIRPISFHHHRRQNSSGSYGTYSSKQSCCSSITSSTSSCVVPRIKLIHHPSLFAAASDDSNTEFSEEENIQFYHNDFVTPEKRNKTNQANAVNAQRVCFENMCLDMKSTQSSSLTKEEPLSLDIVQSIDYESNKENIPPEAGDIVEAGVYQNCTTNRAAVTDNRKPKATKESHKRPVLSNCTNSRDKIGVNENNIRSSNSNSITHRPPKPLRNAPRRLSLHRRVSYDSLPAPSEINDTSFLPPMTSLLGNTTSSTVTSNRRPIASLLGNASSTSMGTNRRNFHRRNTSLILSSKSRNLSTGFR